MARSCFVLMLVGVAACASGGGGGSAVYRRDIGNASGLDAVDRMLKIVSHFQFEVQEQQAEPLIRVETHWKERPPFTDEQALGITNAETRLIITGRIRGQTAAGAVYAINMAVENRVRAGNGSEWNEATNTELFRKYADEMTAQFRKELIDIGVRRY